MSIFSRFAQTQPGPLRIYSTAELIAMPPPEWLIDGVLPQGGLVTLYGPPGCGKSFIAIDMALSVANGCDWHGHTVRQGYPLYISAEAGTGIGKRVLAWLSSHEVKPSSAEVGWLTESLYIQPESSDMTVLFERIEKELPRYPKLIVVDTLARCLDGDENLQEDMSRFVAGVDRLRTEFSATVIVVHHARKHAIDQERGSSALRGAADTMLVVERKKAGGPITLTCNKQRDAEEFNNMSFTLVPVAKTNSAVITDDKKVYKERNPTLLKIIKQYGPIRFSALRDRAMANMSPATVKNGLGSLLESGEIAKENGLYVVREG